MSTSGAVKVYGRVDKGLPKLFELQKGTLSLLYCPTQKNVADIMTKPVSKKVFERHREAMGMSEID
ncbi:hypothetical protein M427DRAFT_35776 [Gonapodya prolifera JEL478]|uniref:Uncharacterized protein n=1 Tax=Gonapodya prolifera (strain JEL478) TaxID=1344416 RepID=A0A139A3V3_GONPJ|nr:hypothetical protein M427DRAFT_35776 [Gonapodya prolifera JEL478]|eukprot:KXS11394.1 hypothetical protein M427DRAFT_35776 [Gonapodya prolifera JEL478]